MIVIPDYIIETKGCVFKLYYDSRYIISMGRSLQWPIKTIELDIDRYKDGNEKGLYWNFCRYINNFPNKEFKIQVLLESENPYQLLKGCQIELDNSKDDTNCLNTFFTPYISKRIQTASKFLKERKYKDGNKNASWINRGHYLNFKRWQYRRLLALYKETT